MNAWCVDCYIAIHDNEVRHEPLTDADIVTTLFDQEHEHDAEG